MPIALSIVLQPPLDALFPEAVSPFTSTSSTVLGALEELCALSPKSRENILQGGSVSPFVHVFVNGAQVSHDALGGRTLGDRDEICLLTAIRGG